MKLLLRIVGILLAVVILIFLGTLAFLQLKGIPTYEANIPTAIASMNIPVDSSRVARGEKIAALLCIECHKSEDGKLAGAYMPDVPRIFGETRSYNITQSKEHGIGNWTDGELYYFLRTGLRKDGTFSPIMPKFPNMADEDIKSVIAWLHSEQTYLQPDEREQPKNKYSLFLKFLANMGAMKPPPLPEQEILVPDTTDMVAFGKYIADGMSGCYACHSADFATNNEVEPEKSVGYYGGGNPMLDREGQLVPSANITMDKETGIGNWTYEDFHKAVKYNQNPRGGPLYYPMFPHTTLTDQEVEAVWAYLQTVPTINNKVERFTAAD